MYDIGMDTLHFMVEVRATGWIGFGVANQAPNNMFGYDVSVGGVFNGSGYLQVNDFLSCFTFAKDAINYHGFDVILVLPRGVV